MRDDTISPTTESTEIADHAARSAWYVLGQPPLTEQDWEDFHQEAALAVWRYSHMSAAYRFVAARSAVVTRYVREMMAHNPAATTPLDVAERLDVAVPDDEAVGLPSDVAVELANLFLAARKQRRGRAVEAALRDVRIVDLLVHGRSNDGIAVELGVPVNSVKKYRNHIKRILETEAQRRGVEDASALRRNTNPAARRYGTRRPHFNAAERQGE